MRFLFFVFLPRVKLKSSRVRSNDSTLYDSHNLSVDLVFRRRFFENNDSEDVRACARGRKDEKKPSALGSRHSTAASSRRFRFRTRGKTTDAARRRSRRLSGKLPFRVAIGSAVDLGTGRKRLEKKKNQKKFIKNPTGDRSEREGAAEAKRPRATTTRTGR